MDYNDPGMSQHATQRRPDIKMKLVVVGDGGCGKTCLLTVYSENRFPEEYVPTVFENSLHILPSPSDPSKTIELALWDTAGQEDFDRLRPLSYNEVDVVLVVFAVNHRPSLWNVGDKWYPELSHFCPDVPLILVGTKTDLRTDPTTLSLLSAQGQKPITSLEAEAVQRDMGAKRYLECSAREGRGVKEVFDAAVREGLKRRGRGVLGGKKGRGKKCVVL